MKQITDISMLPNALSNLTDSNLSDLSRYALVLFSPQRFRLLLS